ncbi:hypothetical protein SISNIDRAFT_466726 [Sistotremastrum niveocremeum HHB9708]|uniref:Uncharacterized protein n=1 Tax=Sistotremastrum niveocremeum HHB9708 TaxID=1314777 RepID=A0A164U2R8_9AGAM|nr:hypothetical protein SISNIDRAFT_466726 [Sistotremastrum niveocremeum HHB9708]
MSTESSQWSPVESKFRKGDRMFRRPPPLTGGSDGRNVKPVNPDEYGDSVHESGHGFKEQLTRIGLQAFWGVDGVQERDYGQRSLDPIVIQVSPSLKMVWLFVSCVLISVGATLALGLALVWYHSGVCSVGEPETPNRWSLRLIPLVLDTALGPRCRCYVCKMLDVLEDHSSMGLPRG